MNNYNRLRQQQLKIEMQRDQNNPENNIVYLNFDLLGPEKLVKTAQPASCKPPIVIARQNSY